MPRLSLDDAELYYEVHGSGPAVTLCHGVGGNHAIWYQNIAALSSVHTVITFDHRGFGCSTDPEGRGRDRFVEDLVELLDHVGVQRTALVGQSMGGGTAVGFTARHPSRVTSLILADSLHGIEAPDEVAALVASASAKTASWGQLERVLGASTRRADGLKGMLYSQISSFNATDRHTLQGSLNGKPTAEELAETGVPITFIVGEEDELFPPDAVRAMHRHVAGSKLVVLKGVGHSAFFENPVAFNEVVVEAIG